MSPGTSIHAQGAGGRLPKYYLWMPQLEYMHLPLYRALRAEGAQDVGFRLFIDEHAFAASRAELAEALLGWLRACEAGTPCGG